MEIIQGGLRVGWHLSPGSTFATPSSSTSWGCHCPLQDEAVSSSTQCLGGSRAQHPARAPVCCGSYSHLPCSPVRLPWPSLAPALRNGTGGRASATELMEVFRAFWKLGSFSLASLSPMHGSARASCLLCRLPPRSTPGVQAGSQPSPVSAVAEPEVGWTMRQAEQWTLIPKLLSLDCQLSLNFFVPVHGEKRLSTYCLRVVCTSRKPSLNCFISLAFWILRDLGN